VFSGLIKEYPDSVLLRGSKEIGKEYLFAQANYVMKLNPDLGEEPVLKRGHYIHSMAFELEGLHICYKPYRNQTGSLADVYEFIDLFETGETHEMPENCVAIGVGQIKDNYCFAMYEDESWDYHIVVHDLVKGTTRQIPSKLGRLSADGQRLYFTRNREGIRCYDFDLNLIWEQSYHKRPAFSGPRHAMFYDDLVIVNQGVDEPFEDRDQRKYGLVGKITAYQKADGTPVWEREFERGVICTLIDGVLYATHNGTAMLIDPRRGDTLEEFSDIVADPHPYDRVWSDGSHLFYISLYEHKVVVLDRSGAPLQELEIPRPYWPPADEEMFYRYKNYYLLPLVTSGRFQPSYAMLVLRPGGQPGASPIPCEPRPEHEIQCLDLPDGKQEYRITITDDKLDNILRYGKILLNECALFNGAHGWSNGEENKHFNGRIRLKVAMTDFNKHRAAIVEMLEEFEKERVIYATFAGDGKSPISAVLEE
jgi:outer membrane protein assembly factor BamB